MTQEQILQAFEGRWRIKGRLFFGDESKQEGVKALCQDFFTAGVLIAESTVCCCTTTTSHQQQFDLFWNTYDKKVGKPKCEKLWAKLTLAEKKACLDYIPLYKQAQPDKQYRKNPETFLRNKSWNDEIIPHNNGTYKPTIEQQRREKLADILTD